MTVDHRHGHLQTLRSGLATFVYPLQYLAALPVRFGSWISESMAFRSSLIGENERMRHQQLVLNTRLQKYEVLEAENMRLRELLQSSFKLGDKVLIAELLAVEMDPFRRQVVLNKGRRDKVYVGQPVVDAAGVMGQVIEVALLSSTAMLITDPAHAIPVQVNRNGLRTVALGSGSLDHLELPHLPNHADIRVDDLLVTSGLGGRFPAGYPVGIVTSVESDPGRSFARVIATPSAMLTQSREVLLVWPFGRQPEAGTGGVQAGGG